MADKKQLKILKQGVEVWNKWRQKNRYAYVDFIGADFSKGNLPGVDFNRADLTEANLSDANLYGADLNNAYLSDADLCGADLSEADLSRADLSGAAISGTILELADLTKADLTKADLRISSLTGADFISADLTGADLDGAVLTGADFTKAKLGGTNLSGTVLVLAVFRETLLTGANFKNSEIGKTVFAFLDLSTARNLEKVIAINESNIDFQTLQASKGLPKEFLFKIGLPENYIENLHDFYDQDPLRLHPVFLSHSSHNKYFANKLYEALTKKQVRVWYDEKLLLPGDKIMHNIDRGVNQYDKFLLVLSKQSLNSWWVEHELEKARKKQKRYQEEHGKRIHNIIPIDVDGYFKEWKHELKDFIEQYKVEDMREWQDPEKFEHSLDRIVKALNADRDMEGPISLL